ncbi:MAG TPA: alpha/beta hydrolase [Jiangellaceae bacterium]
MVKGLAMMLNELRRRYVADIVPDATWREVMVAGVRCEAIVAGNGPPVVLMHGGLDSCLQWVPILSTLSARLRCYVPERPSNGASDAFDYRGLDGDFRSHAAGVVADMFDGLDIDQAPLVGNSMGGLFSLAFATAHPDRVERVVFVGVPAGQEDHALPAPVRMMAHPLTRQLIARLSARAGPRDTRRIVRQLIMARPDRYPEPLLEIATATTRRNARAWRDFASRMAAGGSLRADLRSSDWLGDLNVPASYIVGSRDAFGTAQSIQQLAAGIGAGVTVIPDAGHLPWLDEPDLVTDAIVNSL